MHKIAKNFVKAVAEGRIDVEIKPNHNYKDMLELYFSYPDGSDLYTKTVGLMPEAWGYVEYAGTDGCLVFRTNGFSTQFASYAPDRMAGGINLGRIKLVNGTYLDCSTCWSSRAGVYYTLTGDRLASIHCDNRKVYINVDTAAALADVLGLRIDESAYTRSKDDVESVVGFYAIEDNDALAAIFGNGKSYTAYEYQVLYRHKETKAIRTAGKHRVWAKTVSQAEAFLAKRYAYCKEDRFLEEAVIPKGTRISMVTEPNPKTQALLNEGKPFEFNIKEPGVLIPKWGY